MKGVIVMVGMHKVLSGAAVALAAMSLPFVAATPAHADEDGCLAYLMTRGYDVSPSSAHFEARIMGCSSPDYDECVRDLQAGKVLAKDRPIACQSKSTDEP
ncbi:hypothetical protein [Actinophytocola sp.]|uniref:hypothetical protein n=1 Tax=Actinophytocola sp. TaxID=1872138 RepID=UPI003899B1EF